ncbi:unnamed protein product [Symbiodinium natans]|uniref:Uncharacterized protein n=1 Tax=Symbiodinium natans TaxID=878477 RepID=A0A812JSE1_9DINO|nr:unnamed protein product [Symbiodinium natans]
MTTMVVVASTSCAWNCSKLELQTSLFALGRMSEPSSPDFEAMVAIGLAHVISLHAWSRLVRLVFQVRRLKHKAGNYVNRHHDGTKIGEIKDEYTLITFNERMAVIIIVACVLTQVHCLVKSCVAFRCDDALWNLPNSCVTPP